MSTQGDDKGGPKLVELPAPTAWPIVAAFGLTLLFAGLVTSLAISLVGVLVGVAGAIGWFLDVFPHPKHEAVELQEVGPEPVLPRSGQVQHFGVGQNENRAHVPAAVHPYSAGIFGGLAGAAAMALLACGWGIFNYGSVWYPINVLASVGVPELAAASRETLAHFSAAGLIVGSIAHVTISVLVGLLYTVLLPMLPSRFEWFWGGIVAPVLWSALIFISAGIIAPTLSGEIDWLWFVVCQVAFGLVGGFVVFKSGKIDTMQSWSVAQKMGVEANTGKEHKE